MVTHAQVTELPIDDKGARRRFIRLERAVVGAGTPFVAELDADVDKRLAGRSAFWQETEHTMLIASDGQDVARCVPMVNRRWQRGGREDTGFIGYFAAAPGAGAAAGDMLEAAERWLADRGVRRVLAPFTGNAFHGFATLADGFDEDPVFPLPWQPPHHRTILAEAGYDAAHPFWVYEIDLTSERYRTVAQRAIEDARCTVRPFDAKRWDDELETMRRLQNETFCDEWEFYAMTRDEYREFFGAFKHTFNEHRVLFAEVDGEPVGVCWGLPDWTPLIRSFNGRMGPVQIARFMARAKRYERAGIILIGVRQAHRGRHIGQTLAATLYRSYEERGIERAFYSMVNEGNAPSRGLAESFGGRGRHLYTVYEKQLGR